MSDLLAFTTPVGRIIHGSVDEPQTKDGQGNPLTVKTGANAGQPKVQYYIGLAIPKTPGLDWSAEPWGQIMVQEAKTSMPQMFDPATGAPLRHFAWKVVRFLTRTTNVLVTNLITQVTGYCISVMVLHRISTTRTVRLHCQNLAVSNEVIMPRYTPRLRVI